ncbi:complement factor D-like [Ostrinia furnacalis]|uniref:complement factor D-like n=1 Tax=Ostrinia furnacalis TaxID=93504 RepID=UPI0010399F49|nr:complement factor D-like [Ostrinia furnacalis]
MLVLVLVYFAHLWRAPHAGDAWRVSRRARAPSQAASGRGQAALVRAGGRRACGGVRVAARWAAAPAHCVAARAHPLSAHSLSAWKISYRLHSHLYFETDIVRGVVHSHFNGEDFSNNIGLFEQADPIFTDDYRLDDADVSDEYLQMNAHNLSVVGWEGITGLPMDVPVSPVPLQRCRQYMNPVLELRSYEFCMQLKKNYTIEHGSAMLVGAEVKGLVAWGDKSGHLPLVILHIGYYRNWIENIVNLY